MPMKKSTAAVLIAALLMAACASRQELSPQDRVVRTLPPRNHESSITNYFDARAKASDPPRELVVGPSTGAGFDVRRNNGRRQNRFAFLVEHPTRSEFGEGRQFARFDLVQLGGHLCVAIKTSSDGVDQVSAALQPLWRALEVPVSEWPGAGAEHWTPAHRQSDENRRQGGRGLTKYVPADDVHSELRAMTQECAHYAVSR